PQKTEAEIRQFQMETDDSGKNTGELQSESEKKGSSGAPANVADLIDTLEIGAESTFHRLWLADQKVLALAVLLVQSYLKKLAPLMGRDYHPSEQKRAILAAIRLIECWPDQQKGGAVDRLLLTIDHMAVWFRKKADSGGNPWFLPPSQYFDPDSANGILGAEKRFLRKYEETGKSWKEAKTLKSLENSQSAEEAKQRYKSDHHTIAFYLKQKMMAIHPNDMRLRAASLDKWAYHLNMLSRKNQKNIQQIHKVAVWMMESKTNSARFWRKEWSEVGIRSTWSFRKHFQKMQDQMQYQELRRIGRNEAPGSKRIPRRQYG
ncbi:MAG: hypothetical protein AAF206_26915, partial [Bacteroidota bacterium]